MGMQQDRKRKGEEVWVGNRYAGTETSNAKVGEWPSVAVGYSGTETGDYQVVRSICVVAMEGIRKAGGARDYT